MRVLLAPAANKIDDLHGSGSSKLYELICRLSLLSEEVHAIVAHHNIRGSLPENLYLYSLQQGWQTENTFLALIYRLLFIFQTYFKAKEILSKNDIDVVHHSARVPVSGLGSFNLLAVLGLKGKPFYIGPVQPPQAPVDFGEVDEWLKTKNNIFNKFGAYLLKVVAPLFDYLIKLTFKRSTGVACINESAYEIVKKYVPPEKIFVTYSGIDVNKFTPTYPSRNTDKVKFLSVGYFLPRKGLEHLIRAMSVVVQKHPETELVIVGDGPVRSELKDLVSVLGIESAVHFTGYVPHDRVGEYYKRSDVFVNATLHESYSNTNLEAMASGKALVTTCGKGVSCNADEKTALLVEPGSHEQLARGMVKLIEDADLRVAIAKAGRDYVKKTYDWNCVIDSIIAMYRSGYQKDESKKI